MKSKAIVARCEVDATDVMEAVADVYSIAEPEASVAQEWLDKHADDISDAMHYAWKEYLKTNW